MGRKIRAVRRTSQSTRILRILLLSQFAVLASSVPVYLIIGMNSPETPLSDAYILRLAVVGVCLLIAYGIGMVGVWNTKKWGRVAFCLYAVLNQLPIFDQTGDTKLSLSLANLETVLCGMIIGLVCFAMNDEFGGGSKKSAAVEAFS